MGNRLYSDLIDNTNRRYYFSLETAPGGVGAGVGAVQVLGLQPTVFQQVIAFRTPTQAILTIAGLAFSTPTILPSVGAVSVQGLAPTLQKIRTITNALPPDYTALPDNPPVVLTEWTSKPGVGAVSLQALTLNVSQGGNILTIIPGVGSLSMQGLQTVFSVSPGLGSSIVNGLAPTLQLEIVVTPDTGEIAISGNDPALSIPFTWVDDQPVAASTWIDDP